MQHYLKELVGLNKGPEKKGIYSVCSANEYVILAAMESSQEKGEHLLVEATANQVNQFGGYTGMKPQDFSDFVYGLCEKAGFPKEKLILGGDHLGPLTWANEPEADAMEKSKELIRQFVLAGFTKIHLDTSMRLADDDTSVMLKNETIAKRGAILCKAAEEAYAELKQEKPEAIHPVYIVGSEVPIPGGAQEAEDSIAVTKPSDFQATVSVFEDTFRQFGLENAWESVIGVVVQPGVEFGDESVFDYNRKNAKELTAALNNYPQMVLEGHSTDYQTKYCLREMVEDGIAILKVGPALTYGFREGVLALSVIEDELFGEQASKFMKVLEQAMLENPANWKKHYHMEGNALRAAMKYSYLDRCRYYLPEKAIQDALDRLIENLSSVSIPMCMISQYLPNQYWKIRNVRLKNEPIELIKDKIKDWIADYEYASYLK